MTVAIYTRVSTEKQDVRSQTHAIQEWVNKQDSECVYYTDEGFSGSSLKRPAFKQMQEDIEQGKITKVVVYKLDRISRTATDALELFIQWIRQGLELEVLDNPMLTFNKDDPMRLSKLSMFSEFAQMERQMISERTKAGLKAAVARGKKLGRQAVHNADAVRQLAAQGWKQKHIAHHLGMAQSTVSRMLSK